MFVGFVIVGGSCLVCCCLVVLVLIYVYGCGWIAYVVGVGCSAAWFECFGCWCFDLVGVGCLCLRLA